MMYPRPYLRQPADVVADQRHLVIWKMSTNVQGCCGLGGRGTCSSCWARHWLTAKSSWFCHLEASRSLLPPRSSVLLFCLLEELTPLSLFKQTFLPFSRKTTTFHSGRLPKKSRRAKTNFVCHWAFNWNRPHLENTGCGLRILLCMILNT